ncbi:hypothetical protein Pmani_010340 [Petrolisthes manimaculis]|uniref:Uncharacterized protein n=1 Tax=Petrolisthes manimaculis TaxID=1843537 RepID=A0AAE1Q4P9_9EUCA|nr:hypothetical protein Pmani_010340 [Petrolisthes manimaculis]
MPVPREQLLEALLGEQDLLEEQLCEGRRCTANEQCCDNYICGDFDGASGTCMSHQAQRGEGVECLGDTECGTGLMCEMGYCIPFTGKKHYNEPCTTSSECDVSRGLCCQLVRRYRQEPKTVSMVLLLLLLLMMTTTTIIINNINTLDNHTTTNNDNNDDNNTTNNDNTTSDNNENTTRSDITDNKTNTANTDNNTSTDNTNITTSQS